MKTHPKFREIVAAVAREQGDDVVDLTQIEADVRIAITQKAIDEVWELFGAGLIPAELGEEMLQHLEDKLNDWIFQKLTTSFPPEDRALRAAHLAAHRAARGVRKSAGRKMTSPFQDYGAGICRDQRHEKLHRLFEAHCFNGTEIAGVIDRALPGLENVVAAKTIKAASKSYYAGSIPIDVVIELVDQAIELTWNPRENGETAPDVSGKQRA
jgi:hypothetical protein